MRIRYIIYLLTIFVYSSCGLPYCKKNKFEEEDFKWLSLLSDTILFEETNGSQIDTLVVLDPNILDPKNEFLLDPCGCNWLEGDNEFHAIAVYEMYMVNRDLKGRFLLSKTERKKAAKQSLSFGGLYELNLHYNQFVQHELETFSDGFSLFEDCIIMDSTNTEKGKYYNGVPVTKFVWSQSKGLIYYEIENGSSFHRIFPETNGLKSHK